MFKLKSGFNLFIATIFLINVLNLPSAKAENLSLPVPGTMVNLSATFEPMLIKGLKIHPENPFLFDFIIDTGNDRYLLAQTPAARQSLKNESRTLIKYFLTAMTVPEKDLWVNLSPYEKNRMIAPNLGQTEMGRDMLAQDYILKQLTASLIYPEKNLGKEFWDRVYAKALEMYGTTQIPVNTFNKVWIVADRADIYEQGNVAYIMGAHLKVMLEEDYLSLEKHKDTVQNDAHSISANIVRQIILPEIEHEVNAGKNFSPLRQMFYSMILASWYKMALKNALLTQIYGNQSKVKVGVNQEDPKANEEIFQRYLKAYKKGVFNYIKDSETSNGVSDAPLHQSIPRKYFSGGLEVFPDGNPTNVIHRHEPWKNSAMTGTILDARVDTTPIHQNSAMHTENSISDNPEKIHRIAQNILMEILLGNMGPKNNFRLMDVQQRIQDLVPIIGTFTEEQLLKALDMLLHKNLLQPTTNNSWKLSAAMDPIDAFIHSSYVPETPLLPINPVAVRPLIPVNFPQMLIAPTISGRLKAEQIILNGLHSPFLIIQAQALEAGAEFDYIDIKHAAKELLDPTRKYKERINIKAVISAAGTVLCYPKEFSEYIQRAKEVLKYYLLSPDPQVFEAALTETMTSDPNADLSELLQNSVNPLIFASESIFLSNKLVAMMDEKPQRFAKYPALQKAARVKFKSVIKQIVSYPNNKNLSTDSLYIARQELKRERTLFRTWWNSKTITALENYVDFQLQEENPIAADIQLSQLIYDHRRVLQSKISLNHHQNTGHPMSIENAPLIKGGIDLDRNKMQIMIQGDGNHSNAAQLTIDNNMIKRIKENGFDGLEFKIESITPVSNLPLH